MNTSGHHATSGGLRGHSTGDLYPFGIQGRILDGETYWQPWNLETGERANMLFADHDAATVFAEAWKAHTEQEVRRAA